MDMNAIFWNVVPVAFAVLIASWIGLSLLNKRRHITEK